jgi:hypothetical protein
MIEVGLDMNINILFIISSGNCSITIKNYIIFLEIISVQETLWGDMIYYSVALSGSRLFKVDIKIDESK